MFSVVLILHAPLVTVQQVPRSNAKRSMSTIVQEPSGQSSFVARRDNQIHRESPSQFALSRFATAANLMSWFPSVGLPVKTAVNFPEPLGENVQPKKAAGLGGVQAESPLDCVAVLGSEHSR